MSTSKPPVFDRHYATLRPRSYHRLLTPEEIEHAALDLEEKRWEAVEWARERGIRLLKDEHDD